MGQSENQRPEETEFLFSNNKYAAALPYYQKLLLTDSMNAELNYKTAFCYFNSRSQKEKALPYIKKTILINKKGAEMQPAAYKLLADACFATSHFDEAIAAYKNYEALLDAKATEQSAINEINKQIEICQMAKELKELRELTFSLVNQKFLDTNKKNNSTYQYYTASSSTDQSTLTFTFKKQPQKYKVLSDKDLYEENYVTSHLSGVQLPENTDTSTIARETTVATSTDGQIILIYRNENGDGNLYTSRLNGNEWTVPEKINKNNNIKGWEPNEFITADGETLYFASDREGGFGGKDIYKSVKNANGEWSKAINLGYPVNTAFDDEAPVMHPDGVTLYFSSNRLKIKNRFDIYTYSLKDTGYSVNNVGYPLTKQNTVLPLSERKEKDIVKDNYAATFINSKNAPLTLIKGKVICKDKEIIPYIEITVTDNETGKLMGIYEAESSTGHYSCILPTGKNCNITFETKNYIFHSENINNHNDSNFYKLYKTIELKPVSENSTELLNNVFFTQNEASLTPASFPELNKLSRFMIKNPKLVIELSVTVNSNEKESETISLAENRIRTVTKYLIKKSIDKERIQQKIYLISKKKKRKKREPEKQEDIADKIQLQVIKNQ
jgi:outer membrane protein OmpA-like peptidoglycan-associated protein